MREMKQRRKKERTWAEAARLVLENHSDGPMTPKQILQVIETEGLKEMSGTSPLACLNAMLHSNSRSCDGLFYKLPGRISLFTLKKDAVQWSRSLSAPEGEEADDAESSGSNEAASTVSGDNDVSLDETSSNASCSTEPQIKTGPTLRESHRAAAQASKQKKKAGVMLPRVVLTPLKVNGAHMETSSGFPGKHVVGESSSGSSSALGSTAGRSRTEIARDPPQLFRGFRKPSGGQMKRNRGDDIDFETPGSILVNTNLRALINCRTFNALPLHFQQQLLLLLPEVDRQPGTDGLMRLSGSALNNEFFALAAQSWRERLSDGEFTHEMQVRIRQEMEKEKKTEQWKEKFFEDYYGQKLGLTREDPQPQNSVPNEVEKKSAPAPVEAEPVRVQRGPVTRQRDGHFKKRPLRCRTRRNMYKLQEPKQAKEAAEALPPVEPEPTESRDAKAEVNPPEKKQVSPERESAPEATRVPSKAEDLVVVAAPAAVAAPAERIPILPQEAQEQESKEQKRKCFEQTASPSFPEKKPRLEDRQSFRNTIESVHPEKPQPTKEEPKVPPIRIQLSRIKPPWVVKGQPAYQICPRIIPNPEPSGQDGNRPPAAADFKACALQGRLQREAAAPAAATAAATAIGGGGGPGGGQRGTDEGGGGGGDSGGGHNSRRRRRRRRVRQTGRRPGRWRPKRTHGKCVPDLQRAQLLPPSQLEGKPTFEPAKPSSPPCEGEASFPAVEGERVFRLAAGLTSLGCEDAAQLPEASRNSPFGGARTEPALDCSMRTVPASRSEHLEEISSGQPLGAVVQAERELPSNSQLSQSWQGDSPVNLLGDTNVVEEHDDATAVTLNCSNSTVKGTSHVSSYATGLALESSEEKALEAFSSCGQEHLSLPENSSTPGTEGLAQPFHISQWHSREKPSGLPSCDTGEAPLWKPKAHTEDSDPPQERFALKSCLLTWEALLETGTETREQPAEAVAGTNPFLSDEETRSGLSETTETASDLEAELTDDNADEAAENGDAPGRGHMVLTSECSVRTETSTHIDNLPSEVGTTRICLPQAWTQQPSLPQEDHQPSVCLDLKKPEKPARAASRPLSIEASNPLVVQLLRGSIPLQAVLPGSCSISQGTKPVSALDKLSAARNKSSDRLCQDTSRDKGVDMNGRVRNGYDMYNCLRDSSTKQSTPVPIHLKKEPKGLEEKTSELNPNSKSVRAVSVPRKPNDDALDLRKGTLSSGDSEESKGSPTDLAGRNPEEKLKAAPADPFSSCVTSLRPTQPSGDSVPKNQGAGGKKVFGPGFPFGVVPRAQHPQMREAFPMLSMLSHSKAVSSLVKSAVPEDSISPAREDWPTKPRLRAAGSGGVENKRVPPGPGPAKRNSEKRKEAELMMEQLQALPLARDLSFFRLPREPGKGLAQPLEPSSIPSQLNIKQSFYGKLSKLQLNAPSLSYTSAGPVFPRSLMGSMTALGPKANFAASRSAQMFVDGSRAEEISLKCSCSLKAMIMCKGCGAFCHDDCIGPSKLCVLCLVVR